MESNKILQADILDILFEGKNKEYGAYELRKTYNGRLLKAIGVTATVILLIFVGGIVSGSGTKKVAVAPPVADVDISSLKKDDPPPPVIPPPKIEQPQVRMTQFTPPRIVPNDEVKPDEHPPVNDDLDNVKIGAVNKDGADDVGVVAPPSSDGGKGVVEVPKKDPEPEIWTKVEIESTYPTGPDGWLRFLNKNLHYPDDAQNREIQGVIMVQFIVDEKGNVSNVQAVSGPEEGGLREEAVRVIKKSGLWTAAIQNGRQVKSYKRQPITFKMGDSN